VPSGYQRRRLGILVFVAAAVVGIGISGALVVRSVTVTRMDASGALNNFESIKKRMPGTPPLVARDASGTLVRRRSATTTGPAPTSLHALAYYVDGERLVQADVPMWFFKVKGPAVRYAVRGTGLDLDALNVTATDLEHAGAGVVLDETRSNGDRLLVWTE
jgi:hypothetical protein